MSKTIFLTSNATIGRSGAINPANGFAERLGSAYKDGGVGLFITSMPDNAEFTDGCTAMMKDRLEAIGMTFNEFLCLDNRNKEKTAEYVKKADLIILSGGHVPTENAFFTEINLKEAIKEADGVIIGISAGTMNSAEIVYSQPEYDEEVTDPSFVKFFPGLGLTKIQVLPHYQETKDMVIGGRKLFEEVTYEDSMGHEFIALPDGSYIYIKDGAEEIVGEHYVIKDGRII